MWFWPLEAFSKLKTIFCKYWTSIKINISMTCLYKKYEVKTKMVQEQWLQLKMNFLLDYNMKIVMQLGELTFGGMESNGRNFSRWGEGGRESSNFKLVGGLPRIPSSRKNLSIYNGLAHSCTPIPHLYWREGGYSQLSPTTNMWFTKVVTGCYWGVLCKKNYVVWIALEP